MTVLLTLLIRMTTSGPGSFTLVDSVPLPVYAETAAFAVPLGDELRLFINRPGLGSAAQLRMCAPLRLEKLRSVPLILAGAARCGREVVLTGTDSHERPAVAVVGPNGKVTRQFVLKTESAATPVPACLLRPVVVFQEQARQLAIAELGSSGLGPPHLVPVGDGAIELGTTGGGAIRAIWAEPNAIAGVEIGPSEVKSFRVPAARPQSITIGDCAGHACVAWTEGGSAFLVRLTADLKPTAPLLLSLGEAKGGKLAIISGTSPVAWAQKLIHEENEPLRWVSSLVVPVAAPVGFEGLVHAVVFWQDRLWAVGTDALFVFR